MGGKGKKGIFALKVMLSHFSKKGIIFKKKENKESIDSLLLCTKGKTWVSWSEKNTVDDRKNI